MAKCGKIRRKRRAYCVGDLDEQILIWDRDLRPPLFNTSEQTQSYTNSLTVWAAINTIRGKEIFNGTQLKGVMTHLIGIRFDPAREITEQNVVEYKGNYYDILEVQNLEERDEWLELSCGILGDKSQEDNQ